MWTDIKGLLVMLQSPQGQAPVDHELGALPLDWVEPKPLPKIYVSKKIKHGSSQTMHEALHYHRRLLSQTDTHPSLIIPNSTHHL